MAKSGSLSSLVVIKSEKLMETPEESTGQSSFFTEIKTEQCLSSEPPAHDPDYVMIKEEPDAAGKAQFYDETIGDLAGVAIKVEDSASVALPQSSTPFQFFGCVDWSHQIKQEPELILEQAGGVGEYLCFYCEWVCLSLQSLKKHIKRCHSSLYRGGNSDKGCRQIPNLKRHTMGKHTKGKSYLCPQCDYRASQVRYLTRHIMGNHTKGKPYPCPQCDYGALDTVHLNRHIMYKHTKAKPYPCPQCAYRATQARDLKRHIISKHTKEKPYPCPLCDYGTARAGHLERHIMYKHTNAKPYPCPQCDHRAKHTEDLKTHIMNKHTKAKPYLCPQCDYGTKRADLLKRHIMVKHTKR